MKIDYVAHDTALLLEGHEQCPTCPDARVGRCCNCRDTIDLRHQRVMPDPSEIGLVEHLLCAECYDACLAAALAYEAS